MITDNIVLDREFTWVDVQEPQSQDLERLHSEFGLPYLLVQDCLRPEHLPKYESTDEGHFLMIRSYDQDAPNDAISVQDLTRKIVLFITEKRLLTIHRVGLSYLQKVEGKCAKGSFPGSLQELVHKVILEVIRSYEGPISNLQDLYDDLEDDILFKKTESISNTRIYHFRRRMFVFKRMLKQINDALYHFKHFWENDTSMLQDLRENIDQLYYRLDEISDTFDHLFEIHMSMNGQRVNEVMKVLTVFSTILLPLNFLASFYGMNFQHMPGLASKSALYALIALMFISSAIAIWYFRRKGWFNRTKDE